MVVEKYTRNVSHTVRLLGFDAAERSHLDALLMQCPAGGPRYTCLSEDSLHEPDLYIADGDGPAGLAALTRANPGPVQPAMVVARTPAPLPFPRIVRPFHRAQLHEVLAEMVCRRAQALALLRNGDSPVLTERRRHARLNAGSSHQAWQQRRQATACGAVLILDNRGAFRDHVAKLVGSRRMAIEWTDSASTAVRLCAETPVALVMINTGLAGVDPYAVCAAIKAQEDSLRTAVVLLCGRTFRFDSTRGRDCGLRGVLDQPVADRDVVAVLDRLLG
ncbi:MAG: response regulator [Pseudomonadota bacterium]|nr:response regulator [Pseudomonadota bacterium]